VNIRRTIDAVVHLARAARHARQAARETDAAFAILEREAAPVNPRPWKSPPPPPPMTYRENAPSSPNAGGGDS